MSEPWDELKRRAQLAVADEDFWIAYDRLLEWYRLTDMALLSPEDHYKVSPAVAHGFHKARLALRVEQALRKTSDDNG